MTSRERYLATVQGQPVDYPARLPILMAYAANYIGAHYDAFASDYRVLVEANLRCCADFGIDQLNTMSDPYRETQGFGGVIEYVRDGVPRCPHPPLADTTDLATLARPDPATSERMLDRIRAVELYRQRAGDQYSIMGWVEGPAAEAADLRGVSTFLLDLYDEPEWCGELMDRCVDVAIEFARPQVAAGADTIGIGDAICSQISGDMYTTHIWPRQKRLVDALHAMGALVRLHICGDTTHLLSMVRHLEVDIYDVDYAVSLATAREELGPRVALMGNLDPANAIFFGQPPAIREALTACYRTAGNPYFAGAGCEIPPGTPEANLRALCQPLAYRPTRRAVE